MKKEETPSLEPGLMLPVEFVRAVDGDTIEVEIKRTFHVRLRDIDVIEKREPKGREATEFATFKLVYGKDILVFIPTNNPEKLMDITSFERVLGDIYIDGVKLQDLLREHGYEKVLDVE